MSTPSEIRFPKPAPATLFALRPIAWRAVRALIVTLAIVLTLLGASVREAHAGSYNVYQCHPTYGDASAPGWNVGANGFTGGATSCFNSMFGLTATGVSGGGQYMWWSTPALPSGLKFSNLNLNVNGSTGGGSTVNAIRTCMDGQPVWNGICTTSTTLPSFDTGGQTINTNVPCLHTSYSCNRYMFNVVTASSNYQGSGVLGHLGFGSMNFTVEDLVAPGALPPYSGTLKTSYNQPVGRAWNSGTRTTYVGGADLQGGVKQVEAYADGDTALEPIATAVNSGCNYINWQPCPTTKYDNFGSINTNVLTANSGDGLHTYSVRATDAGGNQHTNIVTFYVDNTAPDTPTGVVTSTFQAGWSATNSFDVDWTNGAETTETSTQSGVETIVVDVDPTNPGTQSDPAAVSVPVGGSSGGIAATVNSIDDVTVPAVGLWRLKIQLRDKAGNLSAPAGGDPAGVQIGYDPEAPQKPTGIANGWIGTFELMSGKPQMFSRPSNYMSLASTICGYGMNITQGQTDPAPTTINVVGNVTEFLIPASTPEGVNYAHFRAITCAGVPGPTETVDVKVDLTTPSASVTGIPASGWTNDGGVVNVTASDELSGMIGAPTEPILRPIIEGASIRFEVDGATAEEDRGGNGAFSAAALAEGNHALTVSSFDVARNVDVQTFSYGVDKTAPSGTFIGANPDDPATFQVAATDALSGPAGGQIEYAPIDGDGNRGTFKPLATTYDNGLLTAVFPDTKLPNGSYALRGKVVDAATNTGYATKDAYGREMVITTPLREAVGMTLSASKAGKLCKKKKAKTKTGRKRANRNYKACVKRLRAQGGTDVAVNVAYGRKSILYGRLTDKDGRPIANESIQLHQQRVGADLKLVGGATTDSDGRFTYEAPAGPSRRVIAYWGGNRRQRDASAIARLAVPTKVSLVVAPRVVHGSRKFTLKGKVFAQDGVSTAGKLVQLQFYNWNRKKWQAGPALVRTDSRGRFAYKYRIKKTAFAKEKIMFRAFVPSETSWAYDAGVSSKRTIVHFKR